MEELEKLVSATSTTDKVFQKRGYDPFRVDIGTYLKTGDVNSFTSTDGARDMMKDVDLEVLNEEVKIMLLKDTATLVGDISCTRVLSNKIPYVIDNWVSRNIKNYDPNDTFDELYNMILSNPSLSRYIVSSIETASLNYDKVENKEYGPVTREKMSFLQNQIEELEKKEKHIDR